MKRDLRKEIFPALAGLTLLTWPLSAISQTPSNSYHFPRTETPAEIHTYSTTAYTRGHHGFANMSGLQLHTMKDTIVASAINPAGVNIALISHDKKGESSLSVYHTQQENKKIFKLDTKKYGSPTAAAFTADARRLAIALPGKIITLDTKKFQPVDTISLVPLSPRKMQFSNNGYYLALIEGSNVVVYNLENKKIRWRQDFEVPVSELRFTEDSQTMGVLTEDGLLSLYDTRDFNIRNTFDELGVGTSFAFNKNGKYAAVVVNPLTIELLNLVKREAQMYTIKSGEVADVDFVSDAFNHPVMVIGTLKALQAERLTNLEPYYAKLISDEAEEMMAEWMKMRPGESIEEYAARVNDATRQKQMRLFEDEISTRLAGDLVGMSEMSLGNYNRDKELLEINFTQMPAVMLPVSQSDITAFHSGGDLEVSDAQYGILPNDSFELIYAEFHNRNNGKTYVYDNLDRRPMELLKSNDNIVSLEIVQQQMMEEMKLQEIKEKVVEEAKHSNVISDHTKISVDSKIVPDYDADGEKILNYVVKFTYEVDPDFSAVEDFAPGKYKISESPAANAMLSIVKQAFEGDFAQYLNDGKKLKVDISGTADATPIVRGIPYDGSYGDFEDEPIFQDGNLSGITVTKAGGIKTNEQLAFLRAEAVRDYLEKNVADLPKMNRDYRIEVGVSQDKGSQHRRITTEFTFVDVF